jgi:hypothetical protein
MTIHDTLCKYIPTLLRPSHADASTTENLLKHAWFLFELCTVSMAASVVHARENKLPKRERFAAEFYYRLDNLVQTLTPMLITRHHEMAAACRLANVALAYLLRVCRVVALAPHNAHTQCCR